MERFFNRFIAFLLGVVFAITSIFGGVIAGGYWVWKNLTPADVTNKVEDLGDLKDYSWEQLYKFFNKAIETPNEYTISELEDKMGVDFVSFLNGLAGKEVLSEDDKYGYVDDLKQISVFALFSKDGISDVLDSLPVGALFNFIPDSILSQDARNQLRTYSVGELIAKDSSGLPGILKAVRNIKTGALFPTVFDMNYDVQTNVYTYVLKDNKKGALNLAANIKLGAIIDMTKGDSDIATQIVVGSLSSVGDSTVGDLLCEVISDEKIVQRFNGFFGGIKVKDLFELDAETGKYVFSVENLLSNIQIGSIIGYTYNTADGKWYKDTDFKEPVTGVFEVLSNLDLVSLYYTLKDDSPVSEKIKLILDQFGDLSVGSVFESLGYKNNGDGSWTDKNGNPVENKILLGLFNISLGGILGDGQLEWKSILQNFMDSLKDALSGITIGDALKDALKVTLNENGDYVNADGTEINNALDTVLKVEISDFLLNIDDYNLNNICDVLFDAFGTISVGDVMGCKKDGGVWYKDGKEIIKPIAILCDFTAGNIIKAAQGEKTVTAIIKNVLGNLTVGDLLYAFAKFNRVREDDGYIYYLPGSETEINKLSDGADKLLNLEIWKFAAAFDKNSDYDVLSDLSGVKVGELINAKYDADAKSWYISYEKLNEGKVFYLPGAVTTVLDFDVAGLLSPDENNEFADYFNKLEQITIGEIFQSGFGYVNDGSKWINKNGEDVTAAFKVLCSSNLTVKDIIDAVKGDKKINIFDELISDFGSTTLGELIDPFIKVISYEDEPGDWEINGKKTVTVIDTAFDIKVSSVLKAVRDKTYDSLANEILASNTVGDFTAEILNNILNGKFNITSEQVDGKWTGTGNFGNILTDTYSIKFIDIYNAVRKIENTTFLTVLGGAYSGVTVGDITYDLIRMFAADKLKLTMSGFECDGITVSGYYSGVLVPAFNVNIKNAVNIFKSGVNSILSFVDDTFGEVKAGDFLEAALKLEKVDGEWTNETELKAQRLINIGYNVSVSLIIKYTEKIVNKETLYLNEIITDVLGDVTFGYYLAPVIGANVNESSIWLDNDGNVLYKPLDALFDTNIKEFITTLAAADKTVSGKIDYVAGIVEDLRVGDYFSTFIKYYDDDRDGIWTNGDGKEIYTPLNNLFSVMLSECYRKLADVNTSTANKISYINNIFSDLKVGDMFAMFTGHTYSDGKWYKNGAAVPLVLNFAMNLKVTVIAGATLGIIFINKIIDEIGANNLGYYIAESVSDSYGENINSYAAKNTDGTWTVTGNFKKVFETTYNLTCYTIYDAVKNKNGSNILKFLEQYYYDIKLGDYTYDITRKILSAKLGLNMTGFAYESQDTDGNYVLKGNFKKVIETVYNLSLNETIDAVKGGISGIKEFISSKFMVLKIRVYVYDVLRKLLKNNTEIIINGYEFENNYVTGVYAALFNSVFNVTVRTVYDYAKAKDVKGLIKCLYGNLRIGELVAGIYNKYFGEKWENTAEITETGILFNGEKYDDLLKPIFNVTLLEFRNGIKANAAAYLLNETDGLLKDVKLGEIIGYALKTTLQNKFNTELTETAGDNGVWISTGNRKEIFDNLLNLSAGYVYGNKDNIKNGIVIPFLGDIKLGVIIGYRYNTGTKDWTDKDGVLIEKSGVTNEIKFNVYNTLLKDVLDKDFDPMDLVKDIYLGEILGYSYVGGDENHEGGQWMNGDVAAAALYATLSDLTIGDCMNTEIFQSKINGVYLGNILGYTYAGGFEADGATHKDPVWKNGDTNVSALYNTLSDLTIGDCMDSTKFNNAINGVYLGNILGYTYAGEFEADGTTHKNPVWTKDGAAVSVIFNTISDMTIGDLTEGTKLNDAINGLYLGEILGYTYVGGDENHENGKWHDETGEVSVIYAKLSDLTLSELMTGDSFTNTISGLYLGEMMGYTYEGIYEADGITHKNAVWKKNGVEVSAMMGILSEYKLGDFINGTFDESSMMDSMLDKVSVKEIFTDVFNSDGTVKDGTSPLSLLDPHTKLGDVAGSLSVAVNNATLTRLISMGILSEDMFAADKPLSLISASQREVTTLAGLPDALQTSMNTATIGRLMDVGALSSLESHTASIDNIFNPIKAQAVLDPSSAYHDRAVAAGSVTEFWKSLNSTEFFDVIFTVIDSI